MCAETEIEEAAAFSSFECNQINVTNDPRLLAFLNRTPYTLKPYTFNRKTRSAPFPRYGLVFFQVRAANLQKNAPFPQYGRPKIAPFPQYSLMFFQLRAANLQKPPHSPGTA